MRETGTAGALRAEPALQFFDALVVSDGQTLLVGANVSLGEKVLVLAAKDVLVLNEAEPALIHLVRPHIQRSQLRIGADQALRRIAGHGAIEAGLNRR